MQPRIVALRLRVAPTGSYSDELVREPCCGQATQGMTTQRNTLCPTRNNLRLPSRTRTRSPTTAAATAPAIPTAGSS